MTELKNLVKVILKEEMSKEKKSGFKLAEVRKEALSQRKTLTENFEIHYSDGIRGRKKANTLDKALRIADELKSKSGMKFVDIYKAGSGFHSTADEKYLIKWWGEGSYWDNKSKGDPSLLKKKL